LSKALARSRKTTSTEKPSSILCKTLPRILVPFLSYSMFEKGFALLSRENDVCVADMMVHVIDLL